MAKHRKDAPKGKQISVLLEDGWWHRAIVVSEDPAKGMVVQPLVNYDYTWHERGSEVLIKSLWVEKYTTTPHNENQDVKNPTWVDKNAFAKVK